MCVSVYVALGNFNEISLLSGNMTRHYSIKINPYKLNVILFIKIIKHKMYSRNSTFNPYGFSRTTTSRPRQQYQTPSRNGPRLCNQCQAPLSCAQLAYCDKCCYCKCCNAVRLPKEALDLASNYPALPLSSILSNAGSSPDTIKIAKEIDELQSISDRQQQELDAALSHLVESQEKLQKTLELRLAEKSKLKRSDATVGLEPELKKQKINDQKPVLKLDAGALAKEMTVKVKRVRKGKEPVEIVDVEDEEFL